MDDADDNQSGEASSQGKGEEAVSGSGSSRGSESEEEEGGVLEKLIDGSFQEDPIVEQARKILVTTKTRTLK